MPDRSPRSIQNPDSVRLALREFHEVGREAFLAKYGIGSARKFELVEDGRVFRGGKRIPHARHWTALQLAGLQHGTNSSR
jgi:hypothetical protein